MPHKGSRLTPVRQGDGLRVPISRRARGIPMKPCPNCGYIVPGAWTECRRCGTSLTLGGPTPAAPAPAPVLAAVPAAPAAPADDALLPGGPRVNGRSLERPLPERPAGPDTWLPRVDPATVVHEP